LLVRTGLAMDYGTVVGADIDRVLMKRTRGTSVEFDIVDKVMIPIRVDDPSDAVVDASDAQLGKVTWCSDILSFVLGISVAADEFEFAVVEGDDGEFSGFVACGLWLQAPGRRAAGFWCGVWVVEQQACFCWEW